METVRKSKNKTLKPKKKSVAAGRKTGVKISKVSTAAEDDGKSQIKLVTSEERRQLISEAAYFRAEQRNFVPGYELEDWLGAEAEIEKKLLEKTGKNRPQSNT